MVEAPLEIKLRSKSKIPSITFSDHKVVDFSFEFLRMHSPSAEVQGHNPDQAKLQLNKENVIIKTLEPVGHYALRLIFDDGHDSGLYTWKYLQKLGRDRDELWQGYLDQLRASGYTRSLTKI